MTVYLAGALAGVWLMWRWLLCNFDWHEWRQLGEREGYPAGSSKVCIHCGIGNMKWD